MAVDARIDGQRPRLWRDGYFWLHGLCAGEPIWQWRAEEVQSHPLCPRRGRCVGGVDAEKAMSSVASRR
jgi:hypothetical protein